VTISDAIRRRETTLSMPVERLAEGLQRLTDLYDREREALLGFVRRRLFGVADAEDVLSEVVLRLIERADFLGQIEDLTAYVYRALANGVTDIFRARVEDVPILHAEDLPAPSPDPEQTAAWREQWDRLKHALEGLSAPERAIWMATELDGRSFKDCAALWDEPIGTLLARKNRAERRLKAVLGDSDYFANN